MLLLVMDVGFENISTVLGKYNVFRVVPRLYGCVYKILWLFSEAVEDSIVVVIIGNQSEEPSLIPLSSQFLIIFLSYLCSVAVGVWNFWP